MKIKICKIQTIEDAILVAETKVDIIGLHAFKSEVNTLDLNNYQKIITEIKHKHKIDFWLLTDNYDLNYIRKFFDLLNIDAIQFQRKCEIKKMISLFTILKSINEKVKIFKTISSNEHDYKFSNTLISKLQQLIDGFVIDSGFKGGSGKTSSIKDILNLTTLIEKPFFLAGGLNINNIESFINGISPYGVDIQSGVRGET